MNIAVAFAYMYNVYIRYKKFFTLKRDICITYQNCSVSNLYLFVKDIMFDYKIYKNFQDFHTFFFMSIW